MLRRDGTRLTISGPVTLATVKALLGEGREQVRQGARCVDLAGVTELDSSLLAMLLAWMREARTASGTLTIDNVPEGLATIARLYGVEALLGTPDGGTG